MRFAHVGTLGLALEPIATALEAVVERLADSALIAVDPNCRPWVVDDHDAYRARLRRVLSHSHVLKVSEEDLGYLEPDLPAVEGVRALLEHGTDRGLLTRGPNGALVVTRTAEVAVPAPRAKVVDTIGAGDAFGGGFLALVERARARARTRWPRSTRWSRPRASRAWSPRARARGQAPSPPYRHELEVSFLSVLTGSFSTPAAENPTVAMIEAAYRHHGIDARYLNCEVAPAALGDAVRGARAMGWAGFNCSIPHKVAVIEHLDGLGESAAVIGAVNCVVAAGTAG